MENQLAKLLRDAARPTISLRQAKRPGCKISFDGDEAEYGPGWQFVIESQVVAVDGVTVNEPALIGYMVQCPAMWRMLRQADGYNIGLTEHNPHIGLIVVRGFHWDVLYINRGYK